MSKVAILVDGGFYKKRAKVIFGDKDPQARADELIQYCLRHVYENKHDDYKHDQNELYRIFYYDCPPSEKIVNHPLTQRVYSLKNDPAYSWNKDFFKALMSKRKVALRMGELLESDISYTIKPDIMKKLCNKTMTVDQLTEDHFYLNLKQKGVDMRIGIDIACLAFKKQVDQIVLISGDSDFVPAAKHARREGIDFILDPMWQPIKDSLNEHIDGLQSKTSKPERNKAGVEQISTKDVLSVCYKPSQDTDQDSNAN